MLLPPSLEIAPTTQGEIWSNQVTCVTSKNGSARGPTSIRTKTTVLRTPTSISWLGTDGKDRKRLTSCPYLSLGEDGAEWSYDNKELITTSRNPVIYQKYVSRFSFIRLRFYHNSIMTEDEEDWRLMSRADTTQSTSGTRLDLLLC